MAPPARIQRQVPGRSVVKAEQKRERTARWHVDLVKQLPCVVTGTHPVDPHHLMRTGEPTKRGIGMTEEGKWAIPLCRDIHRRITDTGRPEEALMEWFGVNARDLAMALWAKSPDLDAMLRIVERAHQEAQHILRRAV